MDHGCHGRNKEWHSMFSVKYIDIVRIPHCRIFKHIYVKEVLEFFTVNRTVWLNDFIVEL